MLLINYRNRRVVIVVETSGTSSYLLSTSVHQIGIRDLDNIGVDSFASCNYCPLTIIMIAFLRETGALCLGRRS